MWKDCKEVNRKKNRYIYDLNTRDLSLLQHIIRKINNRFFKRYVENTVLSGEKCKLFIHYYYMIWVFDISRQRISYPFYKWR